MEQVNPFHLLAGVIYLLIILGLFFCIMRNENI